MALDLEHHGFVSPKRDRRFPNMRTGLVRHFIRGFFDGDGSVSATRTGPTMRILGYRPIIRRVIGWFKRETFLVKARSHPHGRVLFRVCFHGRVDALRFRLALYKDATVYMNRKKKILFSELPRYAKRVPGSLCPALRRIARNSDYPLKGAIDGVA
jgi:hypothetical protein